MKVTGTATMEAPIDKVWESFLTSKVLVSTIPGCERLEEVEENHYLATVTAGVGSIKGSYQGRVELSELKKHQGLTLKARAAGATGTIDVEVDVTFSDMGSQTQIDYEAEATVGGMIAGVGQRMLTSVSRRMANEFFNNVNKVLTGQQTLASEDTSSAESAPAQVTAAAAPGPASQVVATPNTGAADEQFFKGFITGAFTALLSVVVGALVARRR